RSQPFYFYGLIVIAMFLPWSFILPEAVVAAWKNKNAMSSADRLCVVWSVAVVIFFSLSKSKLPGYILTVTVPCGILTAPVFIPGWANPGGKAARITSRAGLTVAILSSVAAIAAAVMASRMDMLAKPLSLEAADAIELGRHFTIPVIALAVLAVLCFLPRF